MAYNLFLDDYRKPMSLKTTLAWDTVKNYNEFVNIIKSRGLPDFISFDHDLADAHYTTMNGHTEIDYSKATEKTGFHCAQFLIDYCMEKGLTLPKYNVHSMNPVGKENILKLLESFEKHQRKEKYEAENTKTDSQSD